VKSGSMQERENDLLWAMLKARQSLTVVVETPHGQNIQEGSTKGVWTGCEDSADNGVSVRCSAKTGADEFRVTSSGVTKNGAQMAGCGAMGAEVAEFRAMGAGIAGHRATSTEETEVAGIRAVGAGIADGAMGSEAAECGATGFVIADSRAMSAAVAVIGATGAEVAKNMATEDRIVACWKTASRAVDEGTKGALMGDGENKGEVTKSRLVVTSRTFVASWSASRT
jgi:hypothetical protein